MTLALAVSIVVATLSPQQACAPEWLPAFGGLPSVDGIVYDSIVFDDGSGPALFVGGSFRTAGGVAALNVARFDGTSWTQAGNGLGNSSLDDVRAFAIFDDGGGPALYVGGDFPMSFTTADRGLARWNGAGWDGAGFAGGDILDMEVFDDGTGPQLYLGGEFSLINGGLVSVGIARFDGSTFSPVDEGVWSGDVTSLVAYDDGSGIGEALYVGGTFSGIRDTTNGTIIDRPGITRWDGANWSPLGQGLIIPTGTTAAPGHVLSMVEHDFGAGPELVIGGDLRYAGGSQVNRLARWNGSAWSGVAGGVTGQIGYVTSITSFTPNGNPTLFVGGSFNRAGGTTGFRNAAALDASGWVNPGRLRGSSGSSVPAVSSVDFGGVPRVLVSGWFEAAGPLFQPWLATWTGSAWETLGQATMALSGEARAAATFDDGTGSELYVAGEFLGAGGTGHPNVARWNGAGWESAGGGIPNAKINDLVTIETPQGPRLYAGGRTDSGFQGVPRVWEFDGANWSALPGLPGVEGTTSYGVLDLQVYSGFGAPRLYAAGFFGEQFEGSHIARWNGANWSNLQGGVRVPTGALTLSPGVQSMCVHDNGTGERLYVAGEFSNVTALLSPNGASNLASFDGNDWYPVTPISSSPDSAIYSIDEVESGGLRRLVAGGTFQFGGSSGQLGLAVLNGSSWSALPALPSDAGFGPIVHGFEVEGQGEEIVVATIDLGPGDSWLSRLYRLEGSQWQSLGESTGGQVSRFVSIDDGANGKVLYALGYFSSLGDMADAFVARWGGCTDLELGSVYCQSNVNSTGAVASTSATGVPNVANNDVTLSATNLPSNAFGYFLTSRTQGTTQFPGGSQGVLCLGSPLGRFSNSVLNSGPQGTFELAIDLAALPQPTGSVAAVPGETWSFQAWFRDANPAPTSNLSSGLEILFE